MTIGSGHSHHIAFVGAGNMASSIIGGLLASGHPADRISAADPFPASLERLRESAPVAVYNDNAEAVATADVIVLAVKPQIIAEAASSIAATVSANGAVVISIAAGVTIASMQARLGPKAAIVRCMPNTPALLRCGASGLFANEASTERQRNFAQAILSAVGMTFLGKVRARTGCGYCLVGQRASLLFPVHGGHGRCGPTVGPGPGRCDQFGIGDRFWCLTHGP